MFFRFLDRHSLRFHFWTALAVAVVLRALAAYFAYGPLAMDDYIDGISPALQWAEGKSPALSPGRSYLLVWLLGALLKVGAALGVRESAVAQVRFLSFALGLFSLLGMAAAYHFGKSRSRRFAALFLYLLAIDWVMPFASTRAFGESVAMPLVLAGVLSASPFGSGIFLGLASLFRFQCGLLFLLFAIFWRGSPRFLAAGLVTLGLQFLVDWGSGYTPLQTLTDYLARNSGGAAQYGVQPWYSHWATLLALFFFPFSLLLLKELKAASREYSKPALAVLLFVLAHSLIPHKEERFLFPILPLVLCLLAAAWALRPESAFRWPFLVVNTALLALATLSNPQAGMVEPIVKVQERFDSGVIIETDNDLVGSYLGQGIFLRKPFRLMRENFSAALQIPPNENVMVTGFSLPDWLHAKCECDSAGSLSDRILFRLNPKHNVRRRPNQYCLCPKGTFSPP